MTTLRRFVDAVWTNDPANRGNGAALYSKPDMMSGSYEQRRLSTAPNSQGVITDFYEFYWAHLMTGTALEHVWVWLRGLLWRWPWRVPAALRPGWYGLWGLTLLALLLAVLLSPWSFYPLPGWLRIPAALSLLLIAARIVYLSRSVVGDAARYLNNLPSNVERRQAIRLAAVNMLVQLHEREPKGYARIIVVGHSLGSVIGYDMLTHAWNKFNDCLDVPEDDEALSALEAQAANGAVDARKYQTLQRALASNTLPLAGGNAWKVTDFITLGSPLTHAPYLLARDEKDFKDKVSWREFPSCPPVLEEQRFSYSLEGNPGMRALHHAAVFGATRWTNLYFPRKLWLLGDPIGGPLRQVFGKGISDRKVLSTRCWNHNRYWLPDSPQREGSHIRALRNALNLDEPLAADPAGPDA